MTVGQLAELIKNMTLKNKVIVYIIIQIVLVVMVLHIKVCL